MQNCPGSWTFVENSSHSSSGSIKNERFSGRGPGTTGQTQTTQTRLSEPDAGQTEQARRAEITMPAQQNGQKEARRTPDKAGQKQAKASNMQAINMQKSKYTHGFTIWLNLQIQVMSEVCLQRRSKQTKHQAGIVILS